MTSPVAVPDTERARALWAVGDYQRVGVRLVPASEQLVVELAVRPGERLLDVGGGTGNTALAAARRDADVVCSDVVLELLDQARRRAGTEGLPFATEVADAQALPFEDATFDVVTSTLGVVYAADPERAAAELVRVLRPGGRLGLTAWRPDGPCGRLLGLIARYDPEDTTGDPLRWGIPDGVRQLFGRSPVQLCFAERTVDLTAPSAQEQWQRYRDWFGPVRVAWERLDRSGRAAFEKEFVQMWSGFSRGSPGISVPSTYLQVIGVRT